MTKVTMDVNGVNVNIDSEVFKGYTQESYGILRKIQILNEDFKLLVETVAETTLLEKKDVSKYLKARFKEATKEPAQQGLLFDALDSVLEG
jgi:hypothetical protein